jgi:S1-C subfamily serine protease
MFNRAGVILAVAGIQIGARDSFLKVREHLQTLPPGQDIAVRVLRAGKILDLTARLP